MVNPVYGLTLKGGVKYTVESAREEAFRNIEYEISMEPHKKYLTDPGYTPGEDSKKPKISKRGRYVNYFSDGTYGVRYYTNWKYVYMYDKCGNLSQIEIRVQDGDKYPFYSRTYNLSGNLQTVAFWVAPRESFEYDLNGNLLSHWKNDYGYDASGRFFSKRSTKKIIK